ncbi:MAG: alkaline phosphatase family protein, partial [Acidimicrobiales bacterium]
MPAPPLSPGSPDPIFPDYRGACLSTLVPALLSGSAGGNHQVARSPDWLPTPAREARQIVLLIVDGLGWQQLISRSHLAPTLNGAAGIERSITSVTPTTTACALTSIATGRPPSDHGLLGYRLATADAEIMNALRWTVGVNRPRDARQELPASTYQPYPP